MDTKISPSLKKKLTELELLTNNDIVNYLPYRYDTYFLTHLDHSLKDKERVVFYGKIQGNLKYFRLFRRDLIQLYLAVDHGPVYLVKAWNQRYLLKTFHDNEDVTISATYDDKSHSLSLLRIYKGKLENEKAIKPQYHLYNLIQPHVFQALAVRLLKNDPYLLPLNVPQRFKEKYRLLDRREALLKVHQPIKYSDIYQGLRSLKYEEALNYTYGQKLLKRESSNFKKEGNQTLDRTKFEKFIDKLPYKLTEDQKTAVEEIYKDMYSTHLMDRLLQGDVGTGKTIVSFIATYLNYLRGGETAMLAPTDFLAAQHYENALKIFKDTDVKVALLTGSTSQENRRTVKEELLNGDIDLLIGTHAVFSKDIEYRNLGLVIIDEQQKFGVAQRAELLKKGEMVDLLTMSATPIPRTLSLTLYGDLDISTLKVFPSAARHVKTSIVDEKSPDVIEKVKRTIEEGKQVYIVVPTIIGETLNKSVIKVYKYYSLLFPGLTSLLHGKMNNEEKALARENFLSGKTPILVSTQMVEVGLDVKKATLMIVYNPTRFGLSELHQLRGRIGRDGSSSEFLLLVDNEDEENAKLKILTETDDGFKIAEQDLALRGPGEITGFRQSGLPSFQYLNVVDDVKIFQCAAMDSQEILDSNNPEDLAFKAQFSFSMEERNLRN